MGELSAARQALLSEPLAPGAPASLEELRNPARRPHQPYQPVSQEVANFHPNHPVHIPRAILTSNLRRARKGAAPGPSGLISEALRLILDDETITDQFIQVSQLLAQGLVPPVAAQLLGFGRMVALQKPQGGIRGLVVGDLFRRLVSRSLAQLFASQLQKACRPWQYALTTRAGTEAVVKALVASTELDPDQTIVSVDGIGAYDHVSRTSMLTGLLQVPEANQCLPFVRLFYANPSCYVWHDQTGTPFTIHQAEGGEQGDPLMPALYCLGQHAALAAIQQQLNPNEALYAFLDDVYLVVPSQRVGDVLRIVQLQLSTQLGRQPGFATSQPRASSLRRPSRQSRLHPTPAPPGHPQAPTALRPLAHT